jgi:uncharacterized protein with HEPN domain
MRARPVRVPEYLEQILDSINWIGRRINGIDETAFRADRSIQDSVILGIVFIGEASRRILTADPEFEERHPDIELTRAYRTRNALIHDYDEIDLNVVWRIATINLPAMKQAILALG